MRLHVKTRILFAVLISMMMGLSIPAMADYGMSGGNHELRKAQHLQQELGLSNGQASQVYNILVAGKANRTPRQQVQGQILSVLMPDQQLRYQQLLSSEQGRRHHHNLNDQSNAGLPGSYPNSVPTPVPQAAAAQPYGVVQQLQQPVPAQTEQLTQAVETMYNPRTGQTYPSQFKYDPHTGEALVSRQ